MQIFCFCAQPPHYSHNKNHPICRYTGTSNIARAYATAGERDVDDR